MEKVANLFHDKDFLVIIMMIKRIRAVFIKDHCSIYKILGTSLQC